MDDPSGDHRRKSDQVSNTVIAALIVIGATILAYTDKLTAEGLLAAYTLAAAIGGVPIVVKRQNGPDK